MCLEVEVVCHFDELPHVYSTAMSRDMTIKCRVSIDLELCHCETQSLQDCHYLVYGNGISCRDLAVLSTGTVHTKNGVFS